MLGAGQSEQARVILEEIAELDRRDADVWLMLGVIAARQARREEALEFFRKAYKLKPRDHQVNYNLGISQRESGDLESALSSFEKVVKIKPDYADALACLAHAQMNLDKLEESEKTFRQAVRLQPRNAELHSNFGSVLQARGLVDEAVDCYRRALAINPNLPSYDSLGSALTGQGNFDEAIAVYREGMRRQPENARVHSNLLLTLNYVPDVDPEEVYREHCRWGKRHGNPAGRVTCHGNTREPDRVLRVGYLSPDFRAHSVAYYIGPLLQAHHRESVEIFCFSLVPRSDATTERLRSWSDHWCDISQSGDQKIVEQVVKDRIDILVDLAGHTAHNRLSVFARKPAPVQVTYLGYPNTTGLSAIDCRLTDVVADPAGADDFYTEHLERLPDCFLCYQPLPDSPPVGELPADENGYITFGSFNNLAKITSAVVALWSDVVKAVPASRLLIKNPSLTDPGRRARYRELFRACGLADNRVELLGHTPTREEHLALYSRVDIGLDTFPYNGTTTTCEALWMGVPVLTLAGNRHAGRVGASLLKCIGLNNWIADSESQFVDRAVARSADLAGLVDMRRGLRDLLAASPLCDSDAFAGKVEAAYRDMWRRWCNSGDD